METKKQEKGELRMGKNKMTFADLAAEYYGLIRKVKRLENEINRMGQEYGACESCINDRQGNCKLIHTREGCRYQYREGKE